MPWAEAPDAHGVWWYHQDNGEIWSRGPGERYRWWSPGPSQTVVNAPWVLERWQRQQLEMMRMPIAHPIAIDTRREQAAPMTAIPEGTAVAEASGHPRNSCIPALGIDAPPKGRSTRPRVQNRPMRIQTCGGSPGSSSTNETQIEAPGEHPQASVATAATAPRQPSSSGPVPELHPPGLGVEVHPPPHPVRPAAELEPISITNERYRKLMATNCFPIHPFTRLMQSGNPLPEVWRLEDFARYGERIGFWERTKSGYNVALKYFRATAQDDFDERDMVLPIAPIAIPQITRDKGPDYTIDRSSAPHAFVWVEMVAHLSNTLRDGQMQTDMALVVGAGIESCVFKKDPTMYDHKSYQIMTAEKKRELKAHDTYEKTWDFVFCRVDGSECALHPDLKKNSITYREVRGPDREQVRTIAPLVPKAGPGKSDGPGTFQRMTRQTKDRSLKWDSRTFQVG